LITIILTLTNIIVNAQQEQQYSQYLINPFTINPAVSSTEDYIDVQLGHRTQWAGLEGAPKSTYATAFHTIGKPFYHLHHRNENKNWHGIGVHVYDDQTGPIHRNALLLAYSYNMAISKRSRLSLGTFLGMKQLRVNSDYWENITDPTDELFSQNVSSGIKPELQLGGVLYSEKYFVTLAGHNLIPQQINFNEDGDGSNYQTHLYSSAGINLSASEKVKITPSFLIKYVNTAPVTLDLNLKISHNAMYWYGVSTRFAESVNIFAGVNLKSMFDITYAFEWSYSKVRVANSGTHEIILGLRLKHPNVVVSPNKYW